MPRPAVIECRPGVAGGGACTRLPACTHLFACCFREVILLQLLALLELGLGDALLVDVNHLMDAGFEDAK